MLAGLCVTLLTFGVHVGEIASFAAFEGLFCVLPGWLAYRWLAGPRPSRLEEIAFGAALGHGLLVLAFAATAALGQRWLLWGVPLVAVVFAIPAARRRGRGPQRARWLTWPVALVCLFLLGFLAAAYLVAYPLPRDALSPSYFLDAVFNLGISADALHHWPLTDPHVAGEPLPYHVFANFFTAATSQATGLDLPLVAFRFFVPTLGVLLALELVVAGRLVTGARRAGVAAAALVLFAGEVDFSSSASFPFLNSFFSSLYESPSFLLGCVVWVPLLALLARQLSAARATARGWVLVALFAVVASGSKASLLPVLALGLGVLVAFRLVRSRTIDRRALVALALALAVFVASYAVIYAGGASGLALRPFAVFDGMSAVAGLPRPLAAAVGTVGFCGPALAGMAGLALVRPAPGVTRQLLASVLVGGALLWLVTDSYTKNQNWFAYPALIAGCLLAAEGLELLWARRRARLRWVSVALGVCGAAFAVGALNTPIDVVPTLVDRIRSHAALYPQDNPLNRGVTPGLARGFRWLREHTDPDDVVALNVQHLDRTHHGPGYWYLTAFGERRVFLEGWGYTAESNRLGFERVLRGEVQPHARRLALNRAVFQRADPLALRQLELRGVRYLFVDRAHEAVSPRLGELGALVYANRDVEIYRVSRPRPRAGS